MNGLDLLSCRPCPTICQLSDLSIYIHRWMRIYPLLASRCTYSECIQYILYISHVSYRHISIRKLGISITGVLGSTTVLEYVVVNSSYGTRTDSMHII